MKILIIKFVALNQFGLFEQFQPNFSDLFIYFDFNFNLNFFWIPILSINLMHTQTSKPGRSIRPGS